MENLRVEMVRWEKEDGHLEGSKGNRGQLEKEEEEVGSFILRRVRRPSEQGFRRFWASSAE